MKLNELRLLEFDLSTKCNAACPQCAREDKNNIPDKSFLKTDNEVTLENVKAWFPKETLENLEVVKFCGTFSEPAIARDFLEIVEYFRNNTNAEIHVHTNGGLRKPEWWTALGKIISRGKGFVVFGIDGLADTHHIYRINTKFERVIENAKAFMAAGGKAKWQFIAFKHNQHQINECKRLSEELGFSEFFVISSDRFATESTQPITEKGDVLMTNDILEHVTVEQIWNKTNVTKVDCHSDKHKWIMVNWNGEVFPCCFTMTWNMPSLDEGADFWQKQMLDNNLTRNNLHHTPLKDILETIGELYRLIKNDFQLPVCVANCGKCVDKAPV